MTIIRIWRTVTLATKAGQYLEFLKKIVVPVCQTAEGNEGLFIMKDLQGEFAHFLLLSLWNSDEALANSANVDSCEIVNPSPEEKSLLIAFESTARRYQVVYTSESSPVRK